jgi:hypothetical protein
MDLSFGEAICPACDGTGRDGFVAGDRIENEPCMNCDGRGIIGGEDEQKEK